MAHPSNSSSFVTSTSPPPLNIAIVRFSALGDVVMVSAAVRALQQSLPTAMITWITSPLAYALLKGMDGVHFEVIEKPRTLSDYVAFYLSFRHRRFDAVLAMQANLRINLLYPALHAPIKIGFDRIRAREGQWLFCNRRIPFRDNHLVDSFLSFVEILSDRPATASWELPLDETDLSWAREQLQRLPKPWVAIHPHASKVERNWLPERYAQVLKEAVSRWQCGVLLTGGNSETEQALCEHLSQLAPDRTLNLCGKTTVKQLAAMLSQVDVLIAPGHRFSAHCQSRGYACDRPVCGRLSRIDRPLPTAGTLCRPVPAGCKKVSGQGNQQSFLEHQSTSSCCDVID